MKQYVECLTDISDEGHNLNYVYEGQVYPLLVNGTFGYKIEVDGPLNKTYEYFKHYFRILSEEEVHEIEIRKEIYGK